MASVHSLKLSEEETEAVRRQAAELGLYQHGFLRTAVRLALGLPVSQGFRDHVAQQLRSQHRNRVVPTGTLPRP